MTATTTEPDMPTGPLIPILRSFDEAEALRFYVDYLGFALDWRHRFAPGMPLYMQVAREAAVLHISEHHGDCTPGAAVRIWVDDVDEMLAELLARPHPRLRPCIEDKPWGLREITLTDPFGNRVIFAGRPEPVDT